MSFVDRKDAGRKLARLLESYKGKKLVVFALPRGGVVTGYEIAKYLKSPLELVITRKIGHPNTPEYAIAAVIEGGEIIGERKEVESVDSVWFEKEVGKEVREARRRHKKYLKGRKESDVKEKAAIVVDDGVATGLTIKAAIKEIKGKEPEKIVVAVPVILKEIAEVLSQEADEIIACEILSEEEFRGSVGVHYRNFNIVEDEDVIKLLDKANK